MRRATLEQGRVTRETTHALVAGHFAQVEAHLRARVRARRAELREEIHRRAWQRNDDVAAIAIAQLEAALEGPVARLGAALREEQARPLHARDRARELELAVQLSSTLAALARESDRLVQRTAERTGRERDSALALVDTRMAELMSAPELDIEPDAVASELLAEFARASETFDAELADGLDRLGRHPKGAAPRLRGFSAAPFGERLGQRVAERTRALVARGEAYLAGELSDLRQRALKRLEARP
jgi:hypothetical protein